LWTTLQIYVYKKTVDKKSKLTTSIITGKPEILSNFEQFLHNINNT